MKKIIIISLVVLLIVFPVALFTIKKSTLTTEITEYLTTEKGYEESEFIMEGFRIIKGRPLFTIKVSFKDEKDVVFLYGKLEGKIRQVYWMSENNERPQKHVEEDILGEP